MKDVAVYRRLQTTCRRSAQISLQLRGAMENNWLGASSPLSLWHDNGEALFNESHKKCSPGPLRASHFALSNRGLSGCVFSPFVLFAKHTDRFLCACNDILVHNDFADTFHRRQVEHRIEQD